MQGSRRILHASAGTRTRALAALLTCALGFTVLTATTNARHRDRVHHQLSVVAKTADISQAAPRSPDLHAVVVDAAIVHHTRTGGAAIDAASTANSRTAVTCSARGPPAQAAA
jgi:hypothetical protein